MAAVTSVDRADVKFLNNEEEMKRVKSGRIIWVFFIFVVSMLTWAAFAPLSEVSTGTGRVVPSSSEQIVQSLEGGILAELFVRQDDHVVPGQVLARLAPAQAQASLEEANARFRAALARQARLSAEETQTALKFPEELKPYQDLIAGETKLFNTRQSALKETLRFISESLALIRDELEINESLRKTGATSGVEVIRLRRQMIELQLKQEETLSQYMVLAREDLSKTSAEVESLRSIVAGHDDSLSRLTLVSPVRGIVKKIEVNTIKGVIPPNGKIMEIVPLDEKLVIETRISPRDIAFIHPGQKAKVKITAYDYAIYGSLAGQVTSISADTIRDEAKPENFYYRAFIQTDSDALVNKVGKKFPIAPGMIATVDISTGSKTVLEYLFKPFNKAGEALRER